MDDGRDDHLDRGDTRCSTAALDLAVPVDAMAAAMRPLERLDGRWSMQSMPQHVNLMAYGSQFTGGTWPSFGRRRHLERSAAAAAAAAAAQDERPQLKRCGAAANAWPSTTETVSAVSVGSDCDGGDHDHDEGDGGEEGRLSVWRRFSFYFHICLFCWPPAAAGKRRVRHTPAARRYKCTTL